MLVNTPTGNINAHAPNFTLKDYDGNSVSLSDQMGEKGLVIAFICNHCPYVQAIIGRLVDDTRKLKEEGINTVAIMSNDYQIYEADSPKNMKKFAVENGFPFPYLVDEDQSVAKAYGAVCTPDFFGFNSKKLLQYRGRLDDAKMGDASNRLPELLHAMQSVAKTDCGPKTQHSSLGCSIKWKS